MKAPNSNIQAPILLRQSATEDREKLQTSSSKQHDLASMAFVAIGSNLGDSKKIVQQAMERLQAFSDEPLLKSSLYDTTPVDCPPGSPRFVNAMVGFKPRPDETPETLLPKLQALEREFGRQTKKVMNEPRPLDLDLIAFGMETRSSPDLILPHPRAHLRRFVLEPMNEIAANYVWPNGKKTVKELLRELSSDELIRRITGS